MRRIRPIVAGLLALGLALGTSSAALGKGGEAVATFDTPLPVDAAPGTTVRIAWTVTMTFDDGSVHPLLAEGVFIRLSPPAGEPIEVPARSDRDGHFVATVTVPSGGLGTVAIGLQGVACRANAACTRADDFFRIAEAPRSAGAVAGAPGGEGMAAGPVPAGAAAGIDPALAGEAAAAKPSAAGADPVIAPAATPVVPVLGGVELAPIVIVGALMMAVLGLGLALRGRRPQPTL